MQVFLQHNQKGQQPMSLNTSDDNLAKSAFTSKLTPAADICVGLAILSVALLSVVGNGLVLVICYRMRKKMVGSELLCVNLAVVDFFCCICFYPLSILSCFNHAWLGENVTCVYYGLGCYIFGLCGMFTIAAISIIRYLKTCNSFFYTWLDGAKLRIMCGVIWLVATLWSSFPLFGWGEYVPEPYGLSCTVAWRGYHTSAKDAFYVICSFACFTLVPVLLIVVSQCQILYKVSHLSNTLSARGIDNNLRHTEKRLSVMFFCISLGFVIAWAPYSVVSLLFIFYKGDWYMAPEGFVFPTLFAKSSHIYNPFIYFYFNKTFQQELRHLCLPLSSKLWGNRVGIHVAVGPQPSHPIHIQLHERDPIGMTQDRARSEKNSKGKVGFTGGDGVMGRPVYTCWGSMSRNSSNITNTQPAKHILSVSI